ncbi:ABC transporter permease [Rhodococcus jostii]|uniref:ABC transporter permease n=1 Tax=Rhodococcus jostii TaxID=132919 RepID=A0ABU4CTA7_RHOJO|nr:ABC transporter permease [Rhodococcus jostii]MDV6286800.1 ABC transporter permease [Rhodococcus jostii]
MFRFLALRVAAALATIWLAFTAAFVILRVLPGDPVQIQLSHSGADNVDLSPQAVNELRANLGLDKPVLTQYVDSGLGLLTGDAGFSIRSNEAVTGIVAAALPATLELAGLALVLGVPVGVLLAVITVAVPHPGARSVLKTAPIVGISLPTFLIGLLLVHFVAFEWRILPGVGGRGVTAAVLPAITLAIPIAAVVGQILGRSLDAVERQPFVRTLRAKGLGERRIMFAHLLRNAALPALTMTGMLIAGLVSGSVVVETVFSRHGMGKVIADAIVDKDTPVALAITVFGAILIVTVNLVIDLLYQLLDPRIRWKAAAVRPRSAVGDDYALT